MAQAHQPLTAAEVSELFPAATPHTNIARYWPYISSALQEEGIGDRAMALLALATIRAESEGFEPIDEHPSTWNTAPGGHPYGLYDERRDLGNLGSGDGEAFRGRGFVQLTGRDNYARYGEQIGVDLLKRPELANDPEVAAHLLARFLKEREGPLRHALASNNLAAARRLVNGGQHGLNRFSDTIRRGQPVTVAGTSSACDTGAIAGLSQQVLDRLETQGALVAIAHPLIQLEGAHNNPWLQPQAAEALIAAVEERGEPLVINSALRTPMQQYLIHQQAQRGECGIQAAAPPPFSNHNSGLAIDIEDSSGWRPYLERHGWQWLGAWDPMHFDYTGGGVDLGGAQVLAFQELWNEHNPEAPLVEDGLWGPATAAAVERSPAAGFPVKA
ncbi:glycoside hydrolase family 19/ distantly related to chitinases [Synechococcus sp. Minos11]|uniref:D-alanyl-D-alanine carboxypeptidase family protein n=1 Tax=Synechococcus sp. Minos11 TaxID=221341 RepID=UPI000DFDB860|nr:D-alanyl-D-alanine carboxypeptidase family protein [Synechococcus sp. Minos11]QNJ09084.1 glycoside hydrolase family 19/ distantly related to chitinases [Synechococcus sp. Minos11]RCL63042.1 MAG: hypothetical protein DBW81_03115 [Synechococcus sp. MED-G67]HCV57249.1 hypothetical protein [Synechococcales bacterium UBA12195]